MPRRAPDRSAQVPSSREAELAARLAEREALLAERDRLDVEREAREAATREILALIRDAPTDLDRVLTAIAESAARLCDSADATVWRREGSTLRRVARFGSIARGSSPTMPLSHGNVNGRAIEERRTVHVADLAAVTASEYPDSAARQRVSGSRTTLVTPLVH